MDDIEYQRSIHMQLRDSEFYDMLPQQVLEALEITAPWVTQMLSKTKQDMSQNVEVKKPKQDDQKVLAIQRRM